MKKSRTPANDNRERIFVIFGHAKRDQPDPSKPDLHSMELKALDEAIGSAEAANDLVELSIAKFRKLNHGREVSDETYLDLVAGLSQDKKIPATCDCCGVVVRVSGDTSLRINRRYYHPKENLATQPDQSRRCKRRATPDPRYEAKRLEKAANKARQNDPKTSSGDAVDVVNEPELTAAQRYKLNRENFYKSEHVRDFILISRAMLGRDYTPSAVYAILLKADENRLWGHIHDPVLAPFQLLAQRGLQFKLNLTPEYHDEISFSLKQIFTTEDKEQRRLRPSDLRLYGRFAGYHHNAIKYLERFPGLDTHYLVKRDFTNSAQEISDHEKTWLRKQPMKLGASPDNVMTASTPVAEMPTQLPKINFANYGIDRDNLEYLQVNAATAAKLAMVSRLRLKITNPANDNVRAVAKVQQLEDRVKDIVENLGPYPQPKRKISKKLVHRTKSEL